MENYLVKTLVVIPTYNEEGRIGQVIDEIKSTLPLCKVAAINDYSRDDSEAEAKAHGAIVINHPYNMGYSAALLTGLGYALNKGYEYVVFFDGDGQHIAAEVKELYKQMASQDADMIIGSRFLKPSDYHHGAFKTMGTKLFSTLIKLFTKKKVTDPTSGFQLLNRKAIACYLEIAGYLDYPDANLIVAMIKKGIKLSEVAVKMRSREDGESMHGGIWKPISYMVLVVYSVLLAALTRNKG